MKIKLAQPGNYLTDLSLPWSWHLNEWPETLFDDKVARGIHRNVVKFIPHQHHIYAAKELMTHIAEKEYSLLRELEELGLPVVEAVGVVTERDVEVDEATNDYVSGNKQTAMENRALIITKYLEGSLPYRVIIERGITFGQLEQMLDALAELLVRLHLVGFDWGDCSLSNALFKRDAGMLTAYLVDAETGNMRPKLSKGQREYDLELAELNISGDLMDLEASCGLPNNADPIDLANSLVDRYHLLWNSLTQDEEFLPDDQLKIEKRIRELNALGFDIEEMEIVTIEQGKRVRMKPKVVEPWHHRRRLQNMTGMIVGENQARRLLSDIAYYQAYLTDKEEREIHNEVAAYRWANEVFQPTLELVPEHLRGGLDEPEVFHEILDHRWFMSEEAGDDVGMKSATLSYIENVLKDRVNTKGEQGDGMSAFFKN